MKKNVLISINGTQKFEDMEPEVTQLRTTGTMEYQGDGAYIVSYEETELTGLSGTTTVFEILPNRVTLSRSGTVESQMVFEVGKKNESLYQLENVGAMLVGVCAQRVNVQLGEHGGTFDLFYGIDIENQTAGMIEYRIDVQDITAMS